MSKMYVCVYCPEDKSLSVLGKNSKRLELHGELREKEEVKMTWGKNDYRGFIVKYGGDEDKLTEYANAANSKILKKITTEDSINVIVDRLTSFQTSRVLLPKRKSVTTEKVALSKKQEEEFSPKKKKRNNINKTSLEADKVSPSKCTTSVTLIEKGKSASADKELKKKTKGEQEKEKQTNSKTLKSITDVKSVAENALLSQFPIPVTEKEIENSKDTRSELNHHERKTRQKLEFSEKEVNQGSSSSANTSLTKTWALCMGNNNPPTPPVDIINFFKALGKPDVRSYIKAFLQFYDTMDADTNSEEQEDGLWTEDQSYVQMLPPLQNNQDTLGTQEHTSTTQINHESNSQNHTFQNLNSLDGSSQQFHQNNHFVGQTQIAENQPHITTNHLQDQSYTGHLADGFLSPVQHQTQHSATQQQVSNASLASNVISHQQEFQWSCTPPSSSMFQMHQSSTFENISQEQQSPSLFQLQTPHSTSKQLNKHQSVIKTSQSTAQQSPVFNQSFNQYQTSTSNDQSPQMHPSQPPLTSVELVRRSPRKHATDVIGETPDLDGKVRLLAKHDVKVHHKLLRKATRAANNASTDRAGYKLASKLVCLLFSDQELAVSCGQGMRIKKGDVRPSLDSDRLEVLRNYVIAWCRKNNKGTPKERDINDAVTEQISYARKKCRANVQMQNK